jgi:hypothetical protein
MAAVTVRWIGRSGSATVRWSGPRVSLISSLLTLLFESESDVEVLMAAKI